MSEAVRTAVKTPGTKENQVSQVQKGNFHQPVSSPGDQILFLQRTIGNQAVQRLMKSGVLQAKLRIGAPGDVYEQEADRVAEQVMRMPQVPEFVYSDRTTISPIQRQCPRCTKKPDKEEEKIHAKEDAAQIPEVSKEVENTISALRGGGQPLDPVTRAYFEPRFGHDFSQVRVHTDARAADSALEINALAYTAGQNVVFGAGWYAPHTNEGRRLLAHELTHVLQQGRGTIKPIPSIDASKPVKADECTIDRKNDTIMTGSNSVVSGFTPSEPSIQRACGPAQVGSPGGCAGVEGDITGEHYLFQVNCDDLKPGEEAKLMAFAATLSSGGSVKIHGFASIEGEPVFNENLSCARAIKIQSLLNSILISSGISVSYSLFKHGATAGDREERRSVYIDWLPAAPAPSPGPSAPPPSGFVCGPDVTTQISDAVSKTKTTFAGWSATDKTDACDALTSLITGGFAWDIVDLHNNAWILAYRPGCASAGGTPPCGSSVKVGPDCHYAGSPNYVIFGVMCKLCHSHFTSISSAKASDFTESAMLDLVNKYKGTGFSGFSTPSANFVPSQNWSLSGYRGWPAAAQPVGDRTNCDPTCPLPYRGGAFMVNWHPKGVF
ncbi:MAG: DUF4157 domain-containing protein [Candidatus Methanoperedens sp.]